MDPKRTKTEDPPLPSTLRFVMFMGVAFLIGWLLMFMLMKGRY